MHSLNLLKGCGEKGDKKTNKQTIIQKQKPEPIMLMLMLKMKRKKTCGKNTFRK